MSSHVNGSCALALVGLLALSGCGADHGNEDGPASGGTSRFPGGAGTTSVPSGGRTASAGTPGFLPPSAGSPATGGTGGTGGSVATGSGGIAGNAGNAGAGKGGTAGASGSPGIPGLPNDPKCVGITPIEGVACDARGPVVCPLGANACACVAEDARSTPVWHCVDLSAQGGAGADIDIGFGSTGGTGRGVDVPGGNTGVAGREPFGFGGTTGGGFSFGGFTTDFNL